MPGLRRLALIAAIGVYVLIVMGGVVRVTGSGLGCPDWPLCHGQILPPADVHAVIEYVHRTVAAVVGVPLLALLVAAWRARGAQPSVWSAVWPMAVLLVPQVLLGREVVLRELPPMLVAVHLGIAIVILGLAVLSAVRASVPASGATLGTPRLPLVTVAAVFTLLMTGAYTRGVGASWVCPGFPFCGGADGVSRGLTDTHMLHRLVATAVGLLIVYQAAELRRRYPFDGRLALWGFLGALTASIQFTVGVAQATGGPDPVMQALHVAGGAATWVAVVVVAAIVRLGPRLESTQGPAGGTWRAYVSLTKPRIISLLLVTTLAGMFLAAEGAPPFSAIVFTMLGGALAAGGANAINQFIDRDIDGLMGRTTLRPIPAGAVSPAAALRFGISLVALSLAIFLTFVNPLSGALAVGAMLYYVFVYTRWLKRATPSNIVIGGAAGALPPVIGWAAVRGDISLLALWLFAIVFYWTPPHFWALSLLLKREYERANVPMLPIVRGEPETRRQIVLYSVLLVALTALLVPLGLMGQIYLVAALLLGGAFVYYALRLHREATSSAARRLFRYSIYYLALLFVAMVVDRRVMM